MQEIFRDDVVALKQRYVCLYTKEMINEWIADL
jgi:hypothetical protein